MPLVTFEELREYLRINHIGHAGMNYYQLQVFVVLSINPSLFADFFLCANKTIFPFRNALVTASKKIDPDMWCKVLFDLSEHLEKLDPEKIAPALNLAPKMPTWVALAIYLSRCSDRALQFAGASLRADPNHTYKSNLALRNALARFDFEANKENYEMVYAEVYSLLKK